jgi:multiple sugar transport system permease protein
LFANSHGSVIRKGISPSYIMILPYFSLFFCFTVLPVLASLIISFTNFNILEWPKFVGWDNYRRLFLEDDVFIKAVKNTIVFAVVTGPISYIACLFIAWVINDFGPKLRALMTVIFYAPSISGGAYFIWAYILSGDRYGFLNGILLKLQLINSPMQWFKDERYVLPFLILVQLWLSLGTGFLAFIAGLQTVDKDLYEAGAMDGIKNRWQELWFITLPSMKEQLMFGAIVQLTAALAVSEISIALAGFPSVNYAGQTMVVHLIDYGHTRFEMGYASAIAALLFLLMILTNKLVQSLLRGVGN